MQMTNTTYQKIFITLFVCFYTTVLFGQTEQQSEANWRMTITNPDASKKARLNALTELSNSYRNTIIDSCLFYAEQALPLAKALENNAIKRKVYYLMGWSYFQKNYDADTIQNTYQKALKIDDTTKDLITSKIYNGLGRVYMRDGLYDKAFDSYKEGLIIAESINDTTWSINILNSIGMVFIYSHKADKARLYLNKALQYAKTIQHQQWMGNVLSNLALTYSKNTNDHDLDTSLILMKESLALKKATGDYNIPMIMANLGELYFYKKDYNTANKYFSEAYKMAKESNNINIYVLGNIIGLLASCKLEQQQPSVAISYLKEGLKILGNGDIHSKMNLHMYLEKAYTLTGDYKLALKNAKIYHHLSDSLFNAEQQVALQKVELKYNVAQKEAENERLKSKEIVADEKVRNRTILAISSMFVLMILAAWSFFIYRSNQRRKALNIQLKTQAKKLQEQSDKLQTLYDYKNKLFSNIAHELRTPLTLIGNPIKSMLKSGEVNIKHRQRLQLVDKNIRSLSSTIYQILDLAKRENVALTAQPIGFNINELVQFIANDFCSSAQFKNITFNKPDLGLALPVVTDGEKLMIVIRNLLSNAFKFTNKGGLVSIQLIDLGEEVAITIQDTGTGIPSTDLDKIFDRHFQVNPANLPKEGGMGIGLAICKEYMTLIKGTIMVESEVGKGSHFTIRFPKTLESTINEETSATFNTLITQQSLEESVIVPIVTPSVEAISNISDEVSSILIVEDNVDMSNYLHSILREEHDVYFAQDGQEALIFLKDHQPDLIISDYMMPNMDGLALVNHLKGDNNLAHIPIIMLTAQQNLDVKVNALRVGVDDYLLKPFDNRELTARVNNILSHQRIIKSEQESEATTELIGANDTMTVSELEWLEELETTALKSIYLMDYNVHQLADEMAVSYSRIFPKIKKLTGLTPNQYLTELRFREARKLLEARKYDSVKAVSYSIGYKNVKNFSKNFKKRFGKSPSEYLRA